jgi:hypothetical protein
MPKTHVKSHDLMLGFCKVCQSSIYALAKPEEEAQMRANEICNECTPKLYRERLVLPAKWKQFPQLVGKVKEVLITVTLQDTHKLGSERAQAAVNWALAWRGEVVKVKQSRTPDTLLIQAKLSDSWQATDDEKLAYLKDWLPAKTRMFTFKDVTG